MPRSVLELVSSQQQGLQAHKLNKVETLKHRSAEEVY